MFCDIYWLTNVLCKNWRIVLSTANQTKTLPQSSTVQQFIFYIYLLWLLIEMDKRELCRIFIFCSKKVTTILWWEYQTLLLYCWEQEDKIKLIQKFPTINSKLCVFFLFVALSLFCIKWHKVVEIEHWEVRFYNYCEILIVFSWATVKHVSLFCARLPMGRGMGGL